MLAADHRLMAVGRTRLSTGVQLGLVKEVNGWLELVALQDRLEARRLEPAIQSGQAVLVEAHAFVAMEQDGEHYRVGTTGGAQKVSLQADPTSELLRVAQAAREVHLGDLLGDLRREGLDATRWEFYAAPFHIELTADLRDRLKDTWSDRDPRPNHGP